MSALNSFKIFSKQGNQIDVEVTIVHPDEHYICRAKNFALQIILELYENIIGGSIYNSNWCGYPFTQDESEKLINPTYQKDFQKLLTLFRGEKISITQEEYDRRVKESDYVYGNQGAGYLSGGAEGCFIGLRPSYNLCCETAETLIEKVELVSFENYPHWLDTFEVWLEYQKRYGFPQEAYDRNENSPNPKYHLRITTSLNAVYLLEHIVPKSFWDSAAYNYEIETRGNFKSVYNSTDLQYKSELNNAHSDEELLRWWGTLSENWKRVFQINLFMQSNYLPIDVVGQLDGFFVASKFHELHPNVEFQAPTVKEISNMTLLKALFATGFGLIDLEPLLLLPNLKILQVEDCSLTNIDSLNFLTRLEYLNVYSNSELRDFTVLKNLTQLKYLYCDWSIQDNIELMKMLPNLRNEQM
jgi:hypothetical protein